MAPLSYADGIKLNVAVESAATWAERTNRPAVAADLRAGRTEAASGSVRVVVAGETSTGKSQLVNALLGRSDLTPTGAGEVTACPITFRSGAVEAAAVTITDPATGVSQERAVSLDAVKDYVHVNSVPLADRADVTLAAGVLDGLVLIDTPGVGGLNSGYGELTMATLNDADALLFVYDTNAPIHQPELDFLNAAATRVANIVIAATKRDANPHFATVVAETQERLRQVPRLAAVPLLVVSATLAQRSADLRAAAAQDGATRNDATQDGAAHTAVAARMEKLSGLEELRAALRSEVVLQAQETRLANLARRASSVLNEVAAQMAASTAVDTPDTATAVAQLDAEAARLKALKDDEQATRIGLSHRFQRLRSEPRQTFEDAAIALRRAYKERLDQARGDALKEVPAALDGDIGAAAQRALEEQDNLVTELAQYLRDRLDAHDAAEDLVAVLGGAPTSTVELPAVGEPARVRGQAMMAAAGSLSIGRMAILAATSLIPGVGGLIVGGAAGGALLAGVLFQKSQQSDIQMRNHLTAWMGQASNDARTMVGRDLDRRALAVQQHVEASLPARLAALRDRHQRVCTDRNNRKATGKPDPQVAADLNELRSAALQADALANKLLARAHSTDSDPSSHPERRT